MRKLRFSQRPISYRLWYAALLLMCVAPLAAAEYLQRWLDIAPCPLCVMQRYGFWVMGLFALFGLLLYLHGGGFTIGSIATHDVLCRELARLSGAMVVSLEYRLAPEHRFPTASNDAWDALAWLAQHAATLGADPARLAVWGDSAGGTLAAVNAILARDVGLPLALQLLFYPGCAAHQDTPSHATYSRGLVL